MRRSLVLTMLAGMLVPLLSPSPTMAALAVVGVNDSLSMKHDRIEVVPAPGVLGNDLNLVGGTSARLRSDVSHGDLTLRSDGGYTYAPDPGYVGTDSFRYVPSGLLATPATVTITVTNAAPTARADGYSMVARTTLTVGAPGVLGNDTDVDGDPLTAKLEGGISGSLDLEPNGAFTYTPGGGTTGQVSFTYRVTDGIAWSAPVTVTLNVAAATPTPTPSPTPKLTASPTPIITLPPPSLDPLPSLGPLPTLVPMPGLDLLSAPPPTPQQPPPGTTEPGDPADSGVPAEQGGPRDPQQPAAPDTSSSSAPSPRQPGDASSGTESPPSAPATGPGTSPVGSNPALGQPAAPTVFGHGAAGGELAMPISLAALGIAGGIDTWVIPSALFGIPGLALIVFVLLQTGTAAAWLPAIRRLRGDDNPEAPAAA